MSLSEFKGMEAKIKALEVLQNSNSMVHMSNSYGDYTCYYHDEANRKLLIDLHNAIEQRDNVIKEVREYEKVTGKKVFK